jgi:hypothetical protein
VGHGIQEEAAEQPKHGQELEKKELDEYDNFSIATAP